MDLHWAIFIAFVGTVALFLVVLFALTRRPIFAGAVAFLFLGIDVGAILGLSVSPVLGAFLTGLFTLAGVGVPFLFSREKPTAGHGAPSTGGAVFALASVAPGILIGLVFGILTRANDLLIVHGSSVHSNLKLQLFDAGFNEEQVASIMGRLAASASASSVRNILPKVGAQDNPSALGGLLSGATKEGMTDLVRASATVQGGATKQLEYIKARVSPQALEFIEAMERKHEGSADDAFTELKSLFENGPR